MYRILYDKRIEKDIRSISKDTLRSILEKIEKLGNNPRYKGTEKLVGIKGYRLRVGNYRVLYQIDDKEKVVKIFRIKHRKEVYR